MLSEPKFLPQGAPCRSFRTPLDRRRSLPASCNSIGSCSTASEIQLQPGWLVTVGDPANAQSPSFDDSSWKPSRSPMPAMRTQPPLLELGLRLSLQRHHHAHRRRPCHRLRHHPHRFPRNRLRPWQRQAHLRRRRQGRSRRVEAQRQIPRLHPSLRQQPESGPRPARRSRPPPSVPGEPGIPAGRSNDFLFTFPTPHSPRHPRSHRPARRRPQGHLGTTPYRQSPRRHPPHPRRPARQRLRPRPRGHRDRRRPRPALPHRQPARLLHPHRPGRVARRYRPATRRNRHPHLRQLHPRHHPAIENGINTVILRSKPLTGTKPGTITLKATSPGLPRQPSPSSLTRSQSTTASLPNDPAANLPSYLERGPTPTGSSVHPARSSIAVTIATAGINSEKAMLSHDDNETTSWSNDGKLASPSTTPHSHQLRLRHQAPSRHPSATPSPADTFASLSPARPSTSVSPPAPPRSPESTTEPASPPSPTTISPPSTSSKRTFINQLHPNISLSVAQLDAARTPAGIQFL